VIPGSDSQLDIIKAVKIITRVKNSAFKRTNPFNLSHPMQPDRIAGLNILDSKLANG